MSSLTMKTTTIIGKTQKSVKLREDSVEAIKVIRFSLQTLSNFIYDPLKVSLCQWELAIIGKCGKVSKRYKFLKKKI